MKKDKDQKIQKTLKKQKEVISDKLNGEDEKVSLAGEGEADEQPNQLKKLQDDLTDARDKYIRLYAEFENHKRRTAQEKINLIQNASEQVLNSLLPVIDDFERAEKLGNDSNNLEGFQLIKNKLRKSLEQFGVKEIEIPVGSDFDADLHEAITKAPASEEKLKGKVMDVIEKGYQLNGKVIRYAKIVIGE